MDRYRDKATFVTPAMAFDDAAHHLRELAGKRGADPIVAIESLDRLRLVVEEVPGEVIQPLRDMAFNRIGRRDPTD